MRERRTSCWASVLVKCACTLSSWPKGVPNMRTPRSDVGTSEPLHTLASGQTLVRSSRACRTLGAYSCCVPHLRLTNMDADSTMSEQLHLQCPVHNADSVGVWSGHAHRPRMQTIVLPRTTASVCTASSRMLSQREQQRHHSVPLFTFFTMIDIVYHQIGHPTSIEKAARKRGRQMGAPQTHPVLQTTLPTSPFLRSNRTLPPQRWKQRWPGGQAP